MFTAFGVKREGCLAAFVFLNPDFGLGRVGVQADLAELRGRILGGILGGALEMQDEPEREDQQEDRYGKKEELAKGIELFPSFEGRMFPCWGAKGEGFFFEEGVEFLGCFVFGGV